MYRALFFVEFAMFPDYPEKKRVLVDPNSVEYIKDCDDYMELHMTSGDVLRVGSIMDSFISQIDEEIGNINEVAKASGEPLPFHRNNMGQSM